ncbi:LOW QUALITY PROTEIN: Ubiquitin carboxyl-terminal hydrolase 2 [Paramyrothecium foliicola]|nr:LOW QUALITY PROTEIN: Ubiquitin carboxyl-terminal hydrolase 2 [Paramyrothecium foliicola]
MYLVFLTYATLPSLEHGLPLLLERFQRFIAVISINNSLVHLVFHLFPGGGLAGGREYIGVVAVGNDLDQPIRQAEEVGFRSGYAAAGEDEIAGAGDADDSREAVSATGAGNDAEAGFGQANGGVGGEDTEVGGKGELEAAAERDGRDGGDGRNRKHGEGGECVPEIGEEVVRPTQVSAEVQWRMARSNWTNDKEDKLLLGEAPALLEIRARAEARVDGARQDQRPRGALLVDARGAAEAPHGDLAALGVVLGVHVVHLGAQGGEQGLGDGVARGRAVKLEHTDVAGARGGQVCDADEGPPVSGGGGGARVEPAGDEAAQQGGGRAETGRHFGGFEVFSRDSIAAVFGTRRTFKYGKVWGKLQAMTFRLASASDFDFTIHDLKNYLLVLLGRPVSARHKYKGSILPVPKEPLYLLLTAPPLCRHGRPLHVGGDVVVLAVELLYVLRADVVGAGHLGEGAYHAERDHQGREDAVGHVEGLGALAVAALVPALPVLPGGVAGGAVLAVPPEVVLVADRLVDGRGARAGPADALGVVQAALGRVAEQVVGGDDEPVTLQPDGLREVVEGGGVFVLVRVVELDELVEALLGIGSALAYAKDFGVGLDPLGQEDASFGEEEELPLQSLTVA